MSQSDSQITAQVHHFSHDRPPNLPDVKGIISECITAYQAAWDADSTGGAVFQLRGIRLSNGSAWVKFGRSVEFREAELQDFVYNSLHAHGHGDVRVACVYSFIRTSGFSYIVMELIDGSTCDYTHVLQISRALEELIAIKAPGAVPGPVRSGPIDHCFFKYNVSSITYPSVLDLQLHLNRILEKEGHTDRLDLTGEVALYGLRLCPSDLNPTNFMLSNGKIVALDFGQASFLPPCFFHYAITVYDRLLASTVRYPKYPTPERNHLDALGKVSYVLTISSNNNGEHMSLFFPPQGC